jgi:hypothetical protein
MNQTELQTAFSKQQQALHDFISSIPQERFFALQNSKWSIADHIGHLTVTQNRIAFGFSQKDKLPAYAAAPRSPLEIQELYQDALQKAVQAGFLANNPFVTNFDHKPSQSAILKEFINANQALQSAFMAWSDSELDAYSMKHPLAGVFSAREMLFFSLYHNSHHQKGIHGLL